MTQLKSLLSHIKFFLDTAESTIRGLTPGKFEEYIAEYNKVNEFANASVVSNTNMSDVNTANATTDTIASLSTKYSNIDRIEVALAHLVVVTSDPFYGKYLVSSLSSTTAIDIKRNHAQLAAEYSAYIHTRNHIRAKELPNLISSLFSTDQKDWRDHLVRDATNFALTPDFEMNTFTTELLRECMIVATGASRIVLNAKIETEKDRILGAARFRNIPMISRANLRPITQFVPLVEIWKMLGVFARADSVQEQFEIAAKRFSIIRITRNVGTPIEFSIRSLIDFDYANANNLLTNQIQGLCKPILTRFQTVRVLSLADPTITQAPNTQAPNTQAPNTQAPNTQAPNTLHVSALHATIPPHHLIIYNNNIDRWTIIESLDGRTYRILSNVEPPYATAPKPPPKDKLLTADKSQPKSKTIVGSSAVSKNTSHANKQSPNKPARSQYVQPKPGQPQPLFVNKRDIASLIDGFSSRAQQYNAAQEEQILKKRANEKRFMLLDEYKSRPEIRISTEPIRRAIAEQLAEWLSRELKSKTPTTIEEIKLLAVNRTVIDEALMRVLRLIAQPVQDNTEQLMTFLQKTSKIGEEFIKELSKNWMRVKLSTLIFKEKSGQVLLDYLVDISNDATKRAVDTLDKLGIWREYDDSLKLFALRLEYL